METLEQIEANVEQTAQGNESPFEDNITVAQSPDEVVAETNENPVLDEDSEARKFQSMYDRSQAELGELKKYEPLVDLLESRPDLVKVLQDNISNPTDGNQSSPAVEVDDFNPWDAFDPKKDTASRRLVKTEMQNIAGQAISKAMAEQQAKMQTEMHLNNTVNELRNNYKMSDGDIKEFLEFSTKPKEQVGLNNLVKLWRDVSGVSQNNTDTLNAVKAAQDTPRSAGVLQGQSVQNQSETDKLWESVKNAGSRNSVL
tara:strand:- start:4722 stop:5492 length:771 start_codon:yes stop_codon:yes gene_type:complete